MVKSTLSQALTLNPDIIHMVFESLPEPTFLLNKQGVYVEAWGGTDTKRHHDPSSIIGLNQYAVLPKDKAEWFSRVIVEVIESGEARELEYELHPKDLPCFEGKQGPTELQYFSAFVIPIPNQELVLWTVRNITEYKTNEQKLARQQKELERLTFIDHLTQVHNRYALDTLLPSAMKYAYNLGQTGALFMIDIDHFKELNDHYGHLTGDSALKKVSAEIQTWCQNVGICFRYGGDEFLVFIRNLDLEQSKQKAQALMDKITALQIPNQTSSVCPHLSITIGIKLCELSDANNGIERYISMADKALFNAKRRERGSIHLLTS